jgi:serine/threonine protein kinase
MMISPADLRLGSLPSHNESGGSPEVDGYEILDKLGRGSVGVVYRARHRELNRRVALKIIQAGSHLSPESRQRFRVEGQAMARLRHPNIVQIYDVTSTDRTTSRRMAERGAVDVAEAQT